MAGEGGKGMKAKETTKKLKQLIKVCGVMDIYGNDDDMRFDVIKECIESKSIING